MRRVLITSALTCAALLGTGMTASADIQARAELYLSVATQDRATGELSFITQASLTCLPTGGTHVNALRACMDLMLADGDFDALRGDRYQVCTQEYEPVVATAEGRWRDRVVAWQRVFGNACTLDAETGWVFRL
jgi:hypothetical protein